MTAGATWLYQPCRPRNMGGLKGQGAICRWEKQILALGPKTSSGRGGHIMFSAGGPEFEGVIYTVLLWLHIAELDVLTAYLSRLQLGFAGCWCSNFSTGCRLSLCSINFKSFLRHSSSRLIYSLQTQTYLLNTDFSSFNIALCPSVSK